MDSGPKRYHLLHSVLTSSHVGLSVTGAPAWRGFDVIGFEFVLLFIDRRVAG